MQTPHTKLNYYSVNLDTFTFLELFKLNHMSAKQLWSLRRDIQWNFYTNTNIQRSKKCCKFLFKPAAEFSTIVTTKTLFVYD